MKTLLVCTIISFCLIFISCGNDEGKVCVKNNVHNVKITSISFGNYQVTYQLLPGEKSDYLTIKDKKSKFPKSYQLQFYMEANQNQVYLQTVEAYQLEAGGTLDIVIDDSTDVENP
jgi:hypothetical protein